MGSTPNVAVPVLVVCSDGSVRWRMGERTTTPGLVVVADCSACEGGGETTGRHSHRRWRVQTVGGYLVGDLSAGSREARAAAAALGGLAIDWRNPQLAVQPDPEVREAAVSVLTRWGLARAAA